LKAVYYLIANLEPVDRNFKKFAFKKAKL